MGRSVLAMFLAASLTLPSAATWAEAPLVGFGDVTLGQPFKDLSAAHKLAKSAQWKAETAELYEDAERQQIAGLTFSISYELKDGAVTVISLRAENDTGVVSCQEKFGELSALLAKKYGAFDHPPSRTVNGATTELYVVKTYADRYIVLDICALDGSAGRLCTTSLRYGLGKSSYGNADKL